jgi:hypothetical protein
MAKESILFLDPEGKEIPFYVVEQTTLAGENYLLVTDSQEDDEANAYIMREVQDEDDQLVYEPVEDEEQMEALSKVFAELLDDVDIQM